MLSPSHVLPFVTHAEEPVRDLALDYLTEAHDPAPVTADDLWRAMERLPSVDARLPVIRRMADLPQTDASVKCLLDDLDATPPGRLRDELEYAVTRLDGAVLRRHRDHILDHRALPKEVRRALRERVEVSDLPADAVWDRLMTKARGGAEDGMNLFDSSEYRGLLDAAERYPELAERAMATLADADMTDWRDVFAADVLGRLRHAPAIDLLVRKLALDDEGDALAETVVDALVQIGTVAVVDAIDAAFAPMAWGPRLSAGDVLRRIKRPESEAAVLRLLEAETDETIRTQLAYALCHLCPTDPRAFAVLRQMADARAFDPSLVDLEEIVLAGATIADVEVPEAPRWRERLGDKAARRAERMRAFRTGMDRNTLDLGRPTPIPPVAAPVRRESPKVGRNDPCPCGSGKKYKKCCGR